MIFDDNKSYIDLITSEHKTKPKFRAYVEKFLNTLSNGIEQSGSILTTYSGTNTILLNMDSLFNIETATGQQLDVLGTLLGITRDLPISDPDLPLPLNDNLYRLVLKSKIIMDNWDGTNEGMAEAMQTLFPGLPAEFVDNQDMTITINLIYPDLSPALAVLIQEGYVVPKPSGVRVIYNIQEGTGFGWDSDTTFISGWDTGIWANN